MHDSFIDDPFNPRFVYFSPVHLDELDGFLARNRFAAHIDQAIAAWQSTAEIRDEQSQGVREIFIELLQPITKPGTVRVDVWVEDMGDVICTFGFLCSSPDGTIAYARGERTITKLDPQSHRPASWSLPFRAKQETLKRNLPAYA